MRIRILVGNMHQVLREIVEELVTLEPDMQLVGRSENGFDLADAVRTLLPDVVIVDEGEAGGSEACQRLVLQTPHVKLVAVGANGRRADLYEFRKTPVAHVSPQGLIDAIRAAVHPDRAAAQPPASA